MGCLFNNGNNCSWIIILIIILLFCNQGTGYNGCGNDCGCNNNCGCC
ncbi:MAG: hypothetical protein J6K49_06825 [Clostridia bacterium]|nr:hypothetical protein [Clostridia bacterium]MBO5432944.1 hypothetical protein [Clostridia bacterium]MBP3560363.1 hypothetical protein [Clostridia bacterium]MBQ6837274.1 hypothetical protein [Clostridia bacterium]